MKLALALLLLALPARGASTLDACDAKPLDQSKWARVSTGVPFWTVALPPGFSPDKSLVFERDGARWKSGKTFVYVVKGAEPFAPTGKKTKAYSECAATVDGKKAVLITTLKHGRYAAGLRFLEGETDWVWGGEGRSAKDQRLVVNILRSARERR